jgi:hypothetical protein
MLQMPNESPLEFNMLEVGPEVQPRGDVSIGFSTTHLSMKITNSFVVADSENLPFRDEAFDIAFSATLEHFKQPSLVLKEMCRIAKRKVIVRYIHKRASGARAPGHINFFDASWFHKAALNLGLGSVQLTNSLDYPISGRLGKRLPRGFQKSLLWRLLCHFERWYLRRMLWLPLEMEAWIEKKPKQFDSDALKFVVVYTIPEIFQKCFSSSPFVSPDDTIAYYNEKNEPLPKFYNATVRKHFTEDVWFVFCHQDFIIKEDLKKRLKTKDTQSIYGPIGVRLKENMLLGQIVQANDQFTGVHLDKDLHVQTLDAQCLMAHVSVFRQGLWFDERFPFHFYDADFCMRAYTMGFDVLAMQMKCQHKSKTLTGDVESAGYLASLADFRKKWKRLLPVKTTTTIVEKM